MEMVHGHNPLLLKSDKPISKKWVLTKVRVRNFGCYLILLKFRTRLLKQGLI